MRILLAAGGSPHQIRVFAEEQVPHILASFAYPKALAGILANYTPQTLILDSGAFTAWSAGDTVDIHEYARWALAAQAKHPHVQIINLDVIPGERGRSSTHEEREEAMTLSLKNADTLRSYGLPTLEAFHQDEPLHYLDHLVQRAEQHNTPACISPRDDVHQGKRLTWLREVMAHILRTRGPTNFPPFHGLGVTSREMLLTLPFQTSDSSSWSSLERFGSYKHARTGKTLQANEVFPHTRNATVKAYGIRQNIRYTTQLQQEVTNIWEKRGITWNK